MKVLTAIHRAGGVNIHGKTVCRAAARAVIQQGDKLLMVYSASAGDYKFPGGGVNKGELREQALARELREECGAELLRVTGELGAIVEYNFAKDEGFETFKMTSYYYFCEARESAMEQNLEEYEAALGFQPIWIAMDEALAKNKALLNSIHPPEWLQREIFALEYLSQSMLYCGHGKQTRTSHVESRKGVHPCGRR